MILRILTGILFLTALRCSIFAQSVDSTRLVYSQEVDSLSTTPQSRSAKVFYRRFIRAQIEEKTLIKVGILPTSIWSGPDQLPRWGLKSEVAIERKLTPAFSVLLAGRTRYQHLGPSQQNAVLTGVLAGRWYYNMPKRIRQQKSANNISDQYLTLEINQQIWRSTPNSGLIPTSPKPGPLVRLAFGTQRRLGRFSYLDASIGPDYSRARPRPLDLTIAFMVGLGL
ncbi:hypothetical protein [Spirosoma sp.]|uniref:hypothetical protein n=1 Tax=Spirosoma sp. TaxID=1899569 RepID=UPI003B3A518E